MSTFIRKLPEIFSRTTFQMVFFAYFAITAPLLASEDNPAKIQSSQRLAPAERMQLISLLSEQMITCINYNGARPKIFLKIAFEIDLDGTIKVGPELKNSSDEASFRPFANSIISAILRCQPYKIPQRFHDNHTEWKNVMLHIDTSDMQ